MPNFVLVLVWLMIDAGSHLSVVNSQSFSQKNPEINSKYEIIQYIFVQSFLLKFYRMLALDPLTETAGTSVDNTTLLPSFVA